MANFPCRIRKYRKAAHLSQGELAALAGLKSQGVISDVEAGRRFASLRVALAYALVFGTSLDDLFPSFHTRIERDVALRARRLHERLSSDGRRAATATHLAALIHRLEAQH